jgi:hypothetical protein
MRRHYFEFVFTVLAHFVRVAEARNRNRAAGPTGACAAVVG